MTLGSAQLFQAKMRRAARSGFTVSDLLYDETQEVDWGTRVRGEFVLVEADRRFVLDPSVTTVIMGGQDLLLANAFELIHFAITAWDRETTVLAGGTKDLKRLSTTELRPAVVLVRKTSAGSNISVEFVHRLHNMMHFLCVRPLS